MKVLVCARLFTGLVDSLATRAWKPGGVPAIYRLLQALSADPTVELVTAFIVKDAAVAARFPRAEAFDLPPIGQVEIVPWRQYAWAAKFGLAGPVREFLHLIAGLSLYYRHRPEVSYVTNANILFATAFARFGFGRVVLRLMGLFPHERRLAQSGKGWLRWCYASPFDHVVCTEEGSGAAHYLRRLLRRDTPLTVTLNGVDVSAVRPAQVQALKAHHHLESRPIVIHVGRLVDYKGVGDFVDGALTLLARRPACADFVLVGDGPMATELEKKVTAAGMSARFRFVGPIPHDEVDLWYQAADIYVSLNRHGNLSNANLEAIATGCCMVLLASSPETHTDVVTDELLSPQAVPRVARHDTAHSLADILERLIDYPVLIDASATETRRAASYSLRPWDDRTAQEIDIIRGTSIPTAAPTPSEAEDLSCTS